LTIDEIANGSSVDPSSAAFKQAISACKDLEPPGFHGPQAESRAAEGGPHVARCKSSSRASSSSDGMSVVRWRPQNRPSSPDRRKRSRELGSHLRVHC
jgi:hypothetical protein